MRKSIFIIGSLMLVFGFILYQFGLSSELHSTTLLGTWLAELAKSIISGGVSLEMVAVILQFAGGLIVMFGLIICFAGAARPNKTQVISGPVKSQEEPGVILAKCRFCDAEIEAGSSFCPKCSKSQK